MKSNLRLRPSLFVLIHAGQGIPFALRLNVRRLSGWILTASFAFLASGLGSLLFFRELEINRKLEERVLVFETQEKLAHLGAAPNRPVPSPGSLLSVSPPAPAAVPSAAAETNTDRTTSALASATLPNPTSETPASAGIAARLSDLAVECGDDECSVRLAMVPTRTGTAQGELLMVLETEVPRIGTGNPTTQVRKRYFLYPGNQTRDELPEEAITEVPRKSFRFTRGLQTTATFTIGKLLRPLAVNVYLYDKDKTLIHHERKAIEREEIP